MLASLLSLMALLAIGLAAFGAGRPLLRALRLDCDDAWELAAWSVALGLVAFGTLWLGLGCVGLLHGELISILTIVAACWGLGELTQSSILAQATQNCGRQSPLAAELVQPPSTFWLRALAGGCAIALVATLVSALAPPTAGDALCYHLELPKRFLGEHRLAFLPDHENSTFPLLVEMWYLWAMALDGGVAAQLVHWALGGLFALATVLLARRIVGRPWAWCAGGIALLTPGVTNQMTAPLNDVGLAAMTTLAVAAWWRAAIDDDGPRWYVVAGLMLGGALGAKYLALLFCAAWFVAWLGIAWRDPTRRPAWLQGAAVMIILAAAIAGPWYARAAWHRGNPVYPFFQTALSEHAAPTIRDSKLPLGQTPWGLAAAPWQVTMHPERFGGRGHQLGGAVLAILPGLMFVRRLRGVRVLLAISGIYFVGCFLLRQNVRFLFPLIPLWAAPCVWVWMELRRAPRWSANCVTLALIAILGVGALWPVHRARRHWAVALGIDSRDAYLERTEPTYRAAVLANLLTGGDAKVLSQDNRGYYFNGELTQESLYRRRTHYDIAGRDWVHQLRRDGFEYLLLADAAGPGIQYDNTLSRLTGEAMRNRDASDFRSVISYRFRDEDGAERSYRLLRIEPVELVEHRARRR